LLLSLQIYS